MVSMAEAGPYAKAGDVVSSGKVYLLRRIAMCVDRIPKVAALYLAAWSRQGLISSMTHQPRNFTVRT